MTMACRPLDPPTAPPVRALPDGLARAVRGRLAELGLSRAAWVEIAERQCGIERTTLYRVLGGAAPNPTLRTLYVLCVTLELTPTMLLVRAGLWPVEGAPEP